MAEYIILFNAEWVPAHTPEQIRSKAVAGWAVIDEMTAAGVFVYSGGGLDASTAVCSVVNSEGVPAYRDGTFTDTDEHLGGFAVIDVADDDQARTWAGRLSVALDWPQELHRFPAGPR